MYVFNSKRIHESFTKSRWECCIIISRNIKNLEKKVKIRREDKAIRNKMLIKEPNGLRTYTTLSEAHLLTVQYQSPTGRGPIFRPT